jgi:hypothetical protein
MTDFYEAKYKATRAAFLALSKERKDWKKDAQRVEAYKKTIDRLKELIRRKDEAIKLQIEVNERKNLNPDVNFMGDDDHKAWSKLVEALKLTEEGK